MIIAVDFDGTIVEHDFPNIGDPLPGAFETMKGLIAAGHELLLNTCREDYDRFGDGENWHDHLQAAIDFCKQNGVEFVGHNENPEHHQRRTPNNRARKVLADIYIDDRNFGGFPGWGVISKSILGCHYNEL